jgi:hypothetical protein
LVSQRQDFELKRVNAPTFAGSTGRTGATDMIAEQRIAFSTTAFPKRREFAISRHAGAEDSS